MLRGYQGHAASAGSRAQSRVESGAARTSERDAGAGCFIDLFAGAGGLSLGLMSAGWRGLFAIEKEKNAFKTLLHNLLEGEKHKYDWPEWLPQKPTTIRRVISRYGSVLKRMGDEELVDLVVGGPPCQGFSWAGLRQRKDPRNQLYKDYMAFVKLVRPRMVLMENVRGISVAFGKKAAKGQQRTQATSNVIEQGLEELGYTVYSSLEVSSNYGVPQRRPRFIIIGIKNAFAEAAGLTTQPRLDLAELIDEARKSFLLTRGLPLDRPVPVWQAISDLRTRGGGRRLIDSCDTAGFKQVAYRGPGTKYQRLLHGDVAGAPDSMRLPRHHKEIKARFARILKSCRRGVQLNAADRKAHGLKKHITVPLAKDQPSHTLTSLPDDLLHYCEPRVLTVREYARIQSFPDWYEFKGKYTTGGHRRKLECPRYTQVANAVPPFVAEVLGTVLALVAECAEVATTPKAPSAPARKLAYAA